MIDTKSGHYYVELADHCRVAFVTDLAGRHWVEITHINRPEGNLRLTVKRNFKVAISEDFLLEEFNDHGGSCWGMNKCGFPKDILGDMEGSHLKRVHVTLEQI